MNKPLQSGSSSALDTKVIHDLIFRQVYGLLSFFLNLNANENIWLGKNYTHFFIQVDYFMHINKAGYFAECNTFGV